MEKAILTIKAIKGKTCTAEFEFTQSGERQKLKKISLPDPASLNNTEVEVERNKMKVIVRVKAAGKEIYTNSLFAAASALPKKEAAQPQHDAPKSVPTQQRMQTQHLDHVRSAAQAPYNFIPLNDPNALVTVSKEDIPDFDSYRHEGETRYTGRIDLQIETMTPLYIRDTLNAEEMQTQQHIEKEREKGSKKRFIQPNFFSPSGRPQIPGSSLRGMLRTLVEIVSFGKFPHFSDAGLYYRGLADKSNLRPEYQSRMSSYDHKRKQAQYKMSAGLLYRDGFDYFIHPTTFRSVHKRDVEKKLGKNYKRFKVYPWGKDYLVVSGDMRNKKHEWIVTSPKSTERIPIPEIDVTHYNNDTTRLKDVPNLTKEATKKQGVPCFYVRWEDEAGQERVSFGHTPMFRLAYELTVGDHVPQELQDPDTIDMAEAIFGNEKTFAGRVFFEDATLCPGQDEPTMGKGIPKILASPKPTTFQHYLVQRSDKNRELNHYNTPDAAIRGYKQYWHRSGEHWQEPDLQELPENDTQHTEIDPVKPHTRFAGSIRFENLSKAELGAILFTLALPEGCCHKLGMGKPLGLGSIKIAPKLYISNRQERYKKLFAEWENGLPETADFSEYMAAFEKSILDIAQQPGVTRLWNVPRLRELHAMLDLELGRALERQGKTRYMQITPHNEFKNRQVLPLPSGINGITMPVQLPTDEAEPENS